MEFHSLMSQQEVGIVFCILSQDRAGEWIPNPIHDNFPVGCWIAIVFTGVPGHPDQSLFIFSAVKKPVQSVAPTIFKLVPHIFL